jgi:hypothetical protein
MTAQRATRLYDAGNRTAALAILAGVERFDGGQAGVVRWARLEAVKAAPTVRGLLFVRRAR